MKINRENHKCLTIQTRLSKVVRHKALFRSTHSASRYIKCNKLLIRISDHDKKNWENRNRISILLYKDIINIQCWIENKMIKSVDCSYSRNYLEVRVTDMLKMF